ncbi:MAG: phytanoyl-CoA dioxygenase family protein [Puniceicoccaceae bacterium]
MESNIYQINEEDTQAFYREGFFVARQFLPAESVEVINQSYDEQIKALQEEKEWQGLVMSDVAQSELDTPRIHACMEELLGGPTTFWHGMYAVVMPGGRGLDWHQDNQYTHILGHMCNAFVALDSITTENAGLWIAPRSHLLGRLPNINPEEGHKRAAEPDNAIPGPPLQPGDALIFHRELLHHSKENRTDRPRRAFAFQVSSASCRFAETGELVSSREDLVSGHGKG